MGTSPTGANVTCRTAGFGGLRPAPRFAVDLTVDRGFADFDVAADFFADLVAADFGADRVAAADFAVDLVADFGLAVVFDAVADFAAAFAADFGLAVEFGAVADFALDFAAGFAGFTFDLGFIATVFPGLVFAVVFAIGRSYMLRAR